MSTLKDLSDAETACLHAYKHISTLTDGINYLKLKLDLIDQQYGYRHDHRMSRKMMRLTKEGVSVQLPSANELSQTKQQLTFVLKAMEKLEHQFGNIKDWNSGDFDYASLTRSPTNVIKRKGNYNKKGYPVFDMFYVPIPRGQYREDKPQGDNKGFFFSALGSGKVYYYLFNPETDSEEEEPQPGPSTSKAEKAKPQSGPKISLGRKGHGLARLLAEAKDPPILEFTGSLEEIKGFRKRASVKYKDLITSFTTTYHWRKKDHKCMFEFKTTASREHFLKNCTLKLPKYRKGNFDTPQ
ncbi:E2 protein [Papillomaviridae sp. Haddock_c6033]|nr:E2 protein [Papillomaviridae sp. Haddock_c6033]